MHRCAEAVGHENSDGSGGGYGGDADAKLCGRDSFRGDLNAGEDNDGGIVEGGAEDGDNCAAEDGPDIRGNAVYSGKAVFGGEGGAKGNIGVGIGCVAGRVGYGEL